jgi:O-antigen/teichoic acid export membrane protein
VRAAYGDDFAASALPLRLLGVALVFLLFHVWQGHVLLAAGRQDVPLAYNLVGLAFNIVLNLVLIAHFGYVGAAVAALATSILIAFCAGVASRVLLGVTLGYGPLSRLLLANGALAATIGGALAVHAHWLGAGLLGFAAYPFFLLLFRVTSMAELRFMWPTRQVAIAGAGAEVP